MMDHKDLSQTFQPENVTTFLTLVHLAFTTRLTSTNEKKLQQVKKTYSCNVHHYVVSSYLYALVIIILIDYVHGTCQSPQYAELGRNATIQCDFDRNTYNVYWYKPEQDITPFIRYEYGSDPPISGSGYDNESYSVDGKGSLIIFEVTTDDERTYKVLAYNRNDDTSETHLVDVHTYAKCEQSFPEINYCKNQSTCLVDSDNIKELSCFFGCSIPTAELRWYVKRGDQEETLTGNHTEGSDGKVYISISNIEISQYLKEPLTQFVCELRGPTTHTHVLQSSIFLDQSNEWENIGDRLTPKYYQINSQATLTCAENVVPSIIIWERTSAENSTEVIQFSEGGRKHSSLSSRWHVNDRGALVLQQVDLTSEGIYRCKFFDGEKFGAYEQSVTVLDYVHGTCQSPQYVELGESATIQCDFDINYYNVYWYKREQDITPFIRYEYGSDPPISGSGYDDESYSVSCYGSLIIFEVTTDKERTYKVLAYNRNNDRSETHFVDVHTYAKCEQVFPVINYCKNQSTCLVDSDNIKELSCSFGCSIPAAELRLYIKHGDQEETITGNHTEESDGTAYISISDIEISQYLKEPLTQLVCELRGPTTHVLQSSIFLDQSNEWEYIGDRLTPKYYQINSQAILTCAENVVPSIVIWERTSAENFTEVIQFSEGGRKHSSLSSRWHVNERGALILHQVDFTSEGIYRCKFFDGEKFGAHEQSATVLVSPSPPFLLVDGCPQTTQPCSINIMTATSYHSVTCYVNELYPKLSLSLENEFADEMAIWNFSSVTVARNDRYSVNASAKLELLDSFSCNDEHFIICRAIGEGASAMVNPDKKIKISWVRCSLDTFTETMDINRKGMPTINILILAAWTLFLLSFIICLCTTESGRRQRRYYKINTSIVSRFRKSILRRASNSAFRLDWSISVKVCGRGSVNLIDKGVKLPSEQVRCVDSK